MIILIFNLRYQNIGKFGYKSKYDLEDHGTIGSTELENDRYRRLSCVESSVFTLIMSSEWSNPLLNCSWKTESLLTYIDTSVIEPFYLF